MKAENIIKHIAFIMDGNGRWAKAKNLPRSSGHKKGAEAAREVIKKCGESGIKYVTLYAFSEENWQRSENEILDLKKLLEFYLSKEAKFLDKNNIRLQVVGEIQKFGEKFVQKIEEICQLTKNNDGLVLTIALSYGSRQEIIRAAKKIANEKKPEEITTKSFQQYLYNPDLPDPDLLVRTGGEKRLSNFLLWQCAYTELIFSDILWPDFNEENVAECIAEYQKRERKFGK